MALEYHLSPRAEQDIVKFIARDNLDAALEMVNRFTRTFELLANNREMGEKYPYPHLQLCQLVVGNYLVIYQLLADELVVFRVIHGARLFDELF